MDTKPHTLSGEAPLTDTGRLIRASRDKFRALVDGIEDEVLSIDPSYIIKTVNRALAGRLQVHPKDLVGEFCYRRMYGFDRPCPEMGLPCPAHEAAASGDVRIAHHELASGASPYQEYRYIEIRSMPLVDFPSSSDELLMVRRDMTLQKLAEIQIRGHNERLEMEVWERTRDLHEANELLHRQKNDLSAANDELIELNNLKKDLTDMVVHDLKGPLSEIQANLEMMSAEPLTELQDEFVDGAKIGSRDLLRMITNLLDVSRLEENRLILDPEPIEVQEFISEALDRFMRLAELNQVILRGEVPEGPPPVHADRRILERIMNNLVSNALDYTPENGEITILFSRSDSGSTFEVRDTGRGIPPELHDRIFDKFSQGQAGRPKTSSGLGLTFCRMAVEAHGGRIWVESDVGQGSRFLFTIPNEIHNEYP